MIVIIFPRYNVFLLSTLSIIFRWFEFIQSKIIIFIILSQRLNLKISYTILFYVFSKNAIDYKELLKQT